MRIFSILLLCIFSVHANGQKKKYPLCGPSRASFLSGYIPMPPGRLVMSAAGRVSDLMAKCCQCLTFVAWMKPMPAHLPAASRVL